MIHMLSGFNLKDDESLETFRADYAAFVKDLEAAGVIAGASPLARRVADTPMDTVEDNPRQYFSVLSFRDRAQLDASYAHIEARAAPGTSSHLTMYRRLRDTVFTCWEDMG
ncbi:hypothetical protein EI983_16555 [Roseovarius faecimaris]|uniref:DUF1330 domain-containing protein n=1 Tax=Roseovarius faecimaris TaxID=2494550 RepID=A0A6I6IRL4_9RHOB|nr:DUF6614 family protein [Roseovarius faecimaris]QGX99790.1 hypothetical protein EI983_16555 [Roseovarius faecimaris]